MIRLYILMRHFIDEKRPRESNAPSWYKDEISRGRLWFYLAHQKRFCEDWRSTLLNLYYCFGGVRPTGTTEYGMRWDENQKRIIKDLIDEAIEKEYLIVVRTEGSTSDTILTTDWRGRKFLQPLTFVEACAREYGYFASILSAFIIGVGGTLLLIFWKGITAFFAG